MRKYLTIILFLSLLCFININDTKAAPSYNITAILDFSGHYRDYGVEARRGIELALRETDAIKVDFFDSQAESDIALNHLNIVNDTAGVVTFTSWVSNAVAPVAAKRNMAQFVIASAVFNYDELPLTVRFTVDVKAEVEFLAGYLQRYERIGILYADNEYGRGWKESLIEALGSKVVSVKSYHETATNFTIPLANIDSEHPEAIVLVSFGEAATIVRQAANMGITAQLIGTRPILTKELLAEPLSEGLIFSYSALDEAHPFYGEFEKSYGVSSSAFGAEGYDLIISLAQAVNEKGTNPADIAAWYRNRSYKGALGRIQFDEHCLAGYDFALKQIRKGEIVSYAP
jgi:branched-chain amino acid transport system substrate-binding protein